MELGWVEGLRPHIEPAGGSVSWPEKTHYYQTRVHTSLIAVLCSVIFIFGLLYFFVAYQDQGLSLVVLR